MDRGEQHAGRRGNSSVEAEFTDGDIMRQGLGVGRADRSQQPECDRQIVMRAFLGKIGRGQVDGDDLGRQRKADRGERGADTLAAFRHRLVRQADNGELRHARRELNLHLDRARLETEIGNGGDGRDHSGHAPRTSNAVQTSP